MIRVFIKHLLLYWLFVDYFNAIVTHVAHGVPGNKLRFNFLINFILHHTYTDCDELSSALVFRDWKKKKFDLTSRVFPSKSTHIFHCHDPLTDAVQQLFPGKSKWNPIGCEASGPLQQVDTQPNMIYWSLMHLHWRTRWCLSVEVQSFNLLIHRKHRVISVAG